MTAKIFWPAWYRVEREKQNGFNFDNKFSGTAQSQICRNNNRLQISCYSKYRVILNDCSRSRPCPCYEIFAAFILCIGLIFCLANKTVLTSAAIARIEIPSLKRCAIEFDTDNSV
jgi:hypothetical protein